MANPVNARAPKTPPPPDAIDRFLDRFLIRRRAWWYNKIPLSFMTLLLLADGKPLDWGVLAALLGLVGTVGAVANYGYALNELYDLEEDRRAGRSNAAAVLGSGRTWAITAASALFALGLSLLCGGWAALALTGVELLLPLTYSAPPLRTKERGWFGVLSDALAAHVYPCLLAFIIVAEQGVRQPGLALYVLGGAWSLAAGLRGILSHQLKTADSDKKAGLETVVHRYGHARVLRLVLFVPLPVEIASFAAMFALLDGTPFRWLAAGLFVLYEGTKTVLNVIPATAFSNEKMRYIPFVDEGYYKVWGPLSLALDACFSSILFLPVALYCLYAFNPRMRWERNQIRTTYKALRQKAAALRSRP